MYSPPGIGHDLDAMMGSEALDDSLGDNDDVKKGKKLNGHYFGMLDHLPCVAAQVLFRK